jgi:hypothetical protein
MQKIQILFLLVSRDHQLVYFTMFSPRYLLVCCANACLESHFGLSLCSFPWNPHKSKWHLLVAGQVVVWIEHLTNMLDSCVKQMFSIDAVGTLHNPQK